MTRCCSPVEGIQMSLQNLSVQVWEQGVPSGCTRCGAL